MKKKERKKRRSEKKRKRGGKSFLQELIALTNKDFAKEL